MNDYQRFIALSRYARWNHSKGRRETWEETVDRYFDFFQKHLKATCDYDIPKSLRTTLTKAIVDLEVMPSMRCLMTAGPALERDNICGYNCAYLPVDSIRAFDECLYVLMCGTGVGFSVERQFVSQLPTISEHFEKTDTTIKVGDSKSGWGRATRELIALLVNGQIPNWDMSALRPAGAVLKTFGGRSSGPEPLNNLFKYIVAKFSGAAGRKLNSLECHDIMCKIGEVVVVGGVRRSAMLSLSNFSDRRLSGAKTGEWWVMEPQRALSNNSIAFTEKPDSISFMREWLALMESGSGERGLFNRQGVKKMMQSRNTRRKLDYDFGTNPCSEIILRPYQFCNLSEVVVREDDTFEDLARKVKLASILGTWQSTLTNFKYLRKVWKENTEEERLLGVSLTGIFDNPNVLDYSALKLKKLQNVAVTTNKHLATKLGIPVSTATTCIKPSGTVSQLVNCASGIHPRYSTYYIRRVRQDKKDPLTQFLIDQGVPHEQDSMNPSAMVFAFPMKSPKSAITRHEIGAIEHMEAWQMFQDHWCEHKPSVTIYVDKNEWFEVGAWVFKNFDYMSGVSFLPKADSDHVYQQAPYEEIDEKKYDEAVKAMPTIDWTKLADYEKADYTSASQELACTGNMCEVL